MCIKGNWENDNANMSDEGVSKVVNQEALERIVETGESVLVGWNKCFS